MKIVQSTWVRFHHFDLARELQQKGHLQKIYTCLPWWRANNEAAANHIPRSKIHCNFLYQGIRRIAGRRINSESPVHDWLAIKEAKRYQRWVARSLPDCDALFAISGTGRQAGPIAKQRGANYIMDRGSTHIRHADRVLRDEHAKWGFPRKPIHPWLIDNEETEAAEATYITVPSRFVRQTFVEQGTDPNKLRVVPYGVDTRQFSVQGTPPEDRFRLVFVGSFSIRKGGPYLLEAFKQLTHPRKELVVVGKVSDEMRQIAGRIGTDGVRFTGVVPREQVKRYLSEAHALVLPSIEEGLALVQAQAMACGCPVIATPNTGCEDLFEDGRHGLIIAVQCVESIVEAIKRIADDPELREQMSRACLSRVSELGGWGTYADGIVQVASGNGAGTTESTPERDPIRLHQ